MKNNLLSAQVEAELKLRRARTTDILEFAKYMHNDYEVAPHHQIIGDVLNDINAGKRRHILLSLPPRSGKSMLCSQLFPAFYLGNHPDKEVIAVSSNSDLAVKFGRIVRNHIGSQPYQRLFDLSLNKDSTAANLFHTSKEGTYLAVGITGQVTGFGADLLLIDDVHKNQDEAMSENIRKKIIEAFKGNLLTRIYKNTSIVVIGTRWHSDDLIGTLEEETKTGLGYQFETVNIPACDEAMTECLWPSEFPIEELKLKRQSIGETKFYAQYFGNPTPESGIYFKKDEIKNFTSVPEKTQYYIGMDLATSDGSGDYTSFTVGGVSGDGRLLILDGWRGQTSSDEWVHQLIRLMKLYKPIEIFPERGAIWQAVENMVKREMQIASTYARITTVSSAGKKEEKARALQGMVSMGVCQFFDGLYTQQLNAEMMSFPTGKHDDMVDSCGILARQLAEKVGSGISRKGPVDDTDNWVNDYLNKISRKKAKNRWRTV